MKLIINEERFLAAIDRAGDHEVGVGMLAPPIPSWSPRKKGSWWKKCASNQRIWRLED